MQVTGNKIDKISIQVSLSGYSFKASLEDDIHSSGWLGSDRIFTTPEFQRRYDVVEISLMTPKFTLVPTHFFDSSVPRKALEEVVRLRENDFVEFVQVPSVGGVLVYSNSIDESLSKAISQMVLTSDGNNVIVLPVMF